MIDLGPAGELYCEVESEFIRNTTSFETCIFGSPEFSKSLMGVFTFGLDNVTRLHNRFSLSQGLGHSFQELTRLMGKCCPM